MECDHKNTNKIRLYQRTQHKGKKQWNKTPLLKCECGKIVREIIKEEDIE